MESLKIDYALYPSILDSYLFFKKRDDDETFKSLFDKINKVKTEQTEEQIKGVEFELCVMNRINELKGLPVLNYYEDSVYITDNFKFDADLINKIAFKLQHSTAQQQYLEAVIPSHLGNIKLYGFSDFTFPDMISDLKTTNNYKCSKYKDHCQAPSYSLIQQINGSPIKAFKYVASDFERMFIETYIPKENTYRKLMSTIFEFISFINYFKSYITNEKIFGQ